MHQQLEAKNIFIKKLKYNHQHKLSKEAKTVCKHPSTKTDLLDANFRLPNSTIQLYELLRKNNKEKTKQKKIIC